MKGNKFFTIVLLAAVMLSGTNFQAQASQSWSDWAGSGIGSAMSSMRSMYGQLPSISEFMSNIVNSMSQISRDKLLYPVLTASIGVTAAAILYKKYKAAKIEECINNIESVVVCKEPGKEFPMDERYKFFADNWKGEYFERFTADKNTFVAAMNIVLENYYAKCNEKGLLKVLKIDEKSGKVVETLVVTAAAIKDKEAKIEECINNIESVFVYKELEEVFPMDARYKFLADNWNGKYFERFTADKKFVAAMNIVLENYHAKYNKKDLLKVLKIDEKSGKIVEISIGKKAKKMGQQILDMSPQEQALYDNMKNECDRSKNKYSFLLVNWKNHISDRWWDESSKKDIIYQNKTIVDVVNRLLREYYPASEHERHKVIMQQITLEDVILLKQEALRL